MTVGPGLTVIVKFTGVPGHPARLLGMMVMLDTSVALTFAGEKLKFPIPPAGTPVAVLSLVQLRIAPPEPERFTVKFGPPPQRLSELG